MGVQGNSGNYISDLEGIETSLASMLVETADEVAHTECFDDEQRSEIYTIIQTLKADTELHRSTLSLLAGKMPRRTADA